MSVWSTYEGRLAAHGETKHDASFLREMRYINRKLPDNLSYQTVTIFDTAHSFNIESEAMVSASFEQNVAIINSDNLNEKYIFSMPQEELRCGCLIEWMDNHWILTELDANSTLYMRGKLLQCNHVLKWVNEKDEIIKQWCAVEDGTKYLTGEFEDRNFIVTRPDARIAVTVPKNSETVKLNRSNRFIIDDPESPDPMAYALTKPLKRGLTYNDEGIFKFVMHEEVVTDNDNFELGIADYYKHFPKPSSGGQSASPQPSGDDGGNDGNGTTGGKKVWL